MMNVSRNSQYGLHWRVFRADLKPVDYTQIQGIVKRIYTERGIKMYKKKEIKWFYTPSNMNNSNIKEPSHPIITALLHRYTSKELYHLEWKSRPKNINMEIIDEEARHNLLSKIIKK